MMHRIYFQNYTNYNLGGQRGLVVKRPPGNQEVGVRTPLQPWREKRKLDIGEPPCTKCAPIVQQDLSERPAEQC